MKERVLSGVLIILLILNLSLVIAQENATVDDKAYACLENKVGDCSSLTSPEDKIFSLLAIGQCKDDIIADSKYKTDTKFTAQAILALDKIKVDTNEAEEWLLSKNKTTSDMDWLLQIESTEETTCTIAYEGLSFPNIIVGEDKKIGSNAGACLTRYGGDGGDYWLKISPTCYTYEFEMSCVGEKSFSTNLLYKKTTGSESDVIYVSADTSEASSGGTTTEKVNSFCFAQGSSCNYEATLWAALVLNFEGYDVSSYLPYLVTMGDEIENKKYFPESFLYSLTNQDKYRVDLLSKQLLEGSWKVSDDKYYDTALALFPFQNEELTEKTNTMNWLEEKQGTDGCWDGGNIRNTAFILYSVWPRGLFITDGEDDDGVDCEDTGYHCMSPMSCIDAGGEDLGDDYTGCFGASVCCSKEKSLETCSEQRGEVCSTSEACSISTIETLDELECCTGYCQTPSEKSECELYGDGDCRTSCYGNEEEADEYDCSSGKICCVEKTVSDEEEKSYWWIWVLLGLIVLVVIGIIFKEKLRPFWLKLKSKIGKSRPGPRPGPRPRFPPSAGIPRQRVMPRRILPPAQRQPVKRPAIRKPRREMEDVLKKLKEMGK